jgi:TonB family protein
MILSLRGTALGALVCAVAFAAPADAQRARDPQLLTDKPAPREGCTTVRQPGTLPSVAVLADSAALAQSMAKFAQEHPIRDGKMTALYSVAFAADGSVERVMPIDYWLPQGEEPQVTALLRNSIRAQRAGSPWSVRLRIDPAAETVFRVGRSEVCQPRSTTRFELSTAALDQQQAPPPMRVRVIVGTQGEIRSLEIVRSSGERELDRWVHDSLLSRRFQPGLIDGVPVTMERDEDVRLRYRP